MEYIRAAAEDPQGCVFCSLPEKEPDRVLAKGAEAFVVLNKFPYNPGHVLIVPFRHVAELSELEPEERNEMQSFIERSVRAIREESDPHGFNIGMNLGRPAGAGIPEHLHWHVVPRWSGDTNFMSIVGETRVLPELLEETARRLAPRFA
jgi:ATP adenylyltransferase